MDPSIISSLIKEAIRAPSGDNMQPWQFKINSDYLQILLDKNADDSIFNFNQRGSYIAIGALLTNLKIISAKNNFETLIDLWPDSANTLYIARVNFKENNSLDSKLYESISQRVTNRSTYEVDSHLIEDEQIFNDWKNNFSKISLKFLRGDVVKEAVQILALAEYVMLVTQKMRHSFFKIIRWTEKEEILHKNGLSINSLMLPPPAKFIFKLFASIFWSQILVFLKFPKIVQKENAKLYASSGILGAITTKDFSNNSLIYLGMAFEELWLTATYHNLAIQPLAGLIFLRHCLKDGGGKDISEINQKMIKDGYISLANIFSLNSGEDFGMIFRIGR